ncbi:MAG TPA: hypothetical protein VGQ09_00600 [Chitinophagaceae bacterium]|jgi:hypothetical protein|nr:hypothetical protein [Chitinophagaceae bacterium]
MTGNIAGEIEKKYGSILFKDPSIEFGYNIIIIKNRLPIIEKIFFFIISAGAMSVIVLKLLLPLSLIYIVIGVTTLLYYSSSAFQRVEINFLRNEVVVQNKLPYVDKIRKKLLNKPPVIPFHEIANFENVQHKHNYFIGPNSSFGSLGERRSLLVLNSFDHSPITLAEFRFERDSRRLAELLQVYIKGRTKMSNIVFKSATKDE